MDLSSFKTICVEYKRMGGGELGLSSSQSDVLYDSLLNDKVNLLEQYRKSFWVYTTTTLKGAKKLTDKEVLNFQKVLGFIAITFGGPEKADYQAMFGVNAFEVI